MNTAINIEFDLEVELRMSSKKEYHDTFDKKFDIVFDTIDVQHFSLFEIINKIKALPFPAVVQFQQQNLDQSLF